MSTAWMAKANCVGVDPDTFFPEFGGRPSKEIRAICSACPVAAECLDYALENEMRGIWGGTWETERTRILGRKIRAADSGLCSGGHLRTERNTRIDQNGWRRCLDCRREDDLARADVA